MEFGSPATISRTEPLESCTSASAAKCCGSGLGPSLSTRGGVITFSSKLALVPDPSSRVMTVIRWSGPPTSRQLVISPLKMPRTWSRVTDRTGLDLWTMSTMPSSAIGIASMPVSSGVSDRDDIPIWQMPLDTALMPALDPPPWTLTLTSRCCDI
jgi:hypothetical protein